MQATDGRLTAAGVASVEALQRLPHNVIGWSDGLQAENWQLKRFLFDNMYRHYRVVRMQVKAENILGALFNAYMTEPAQLPREISRHAEAPGDQARAVCDYIAGMTDRYALDEHSKLFDPYTLP